MVYVLFCDMLLLLCSQQDRFLGVLKGPFDGAEEYCPTFLVDGPLPAQVQLLNGLRRDHVYSLLCTLDLQNRCMIVINVIQA